MKQLLFLLKKLLLVVGHMSIFYNIGMLLLSKIGYPDWRLLSVLVFIGSLYGTIKLEIELNDVLIPPMVINFFVLLFMAFFALFIPEPLHSFLLLLLGYWYGFFLRCIFDQN